MEIKRQSLRVTDLKSVSVPKEIITERAVSEKYELGFESLLRLRMKVDSNPIKCRHRRHKSFG